MQPPSVRPLNVGHAPSSENVAARMWHMFPSLPALSRQRRKTNKTNFLTHRLSTGRVFIISQPSRQYWDGGTVPPQVKAVAGACAPLESDTLVSPQNH